MADKRSVVTAIGGHLLAVAVCLTPLAFVEPMAVGGGSMLPALGPGDLALVSRDGRAARGDIALIDEPGHSAVLHRIVSVDRRGRYRTRGDANPVGDIQPVSRSSVRGRVVAVVPFGKMLSRWRELR